MKGNNPKQALETKARMVLANIIRYGEGRRPEAMEAFEFLKLPGVGIRTFEKIGELMHRGVCVRPICFYKNRMGRECASSGDEGCEWWVKSFERVTVEQ